MLTGPPAALTAFATAFEAITAERIDNSETLKGIVGAVQRKLVVELG